MNALIPGSFDPMTLGHVNIVERASPMFDRIYVAVMNNDSSRYDPSLSSKESYMFSQSERLEIARLSVSHIKNAVPVAYGGMLIDLCDMYDISAVIRGVRGACDLEYEMKHAKWNREHNARAQTLFMPSDEKFGSLSSTAVREVIARGGDMSSLEGYISPDALAYIKTLFSDRKGK